MNRRNWSPDGERILRRATELSFPRYPGTEGDRRAIEWVRDRFVDAGLETAIEEFTYDVRPAFRALRAMLLACAALVGVATWQAAARPLFALVLTGAALAAGLVFLTWAPGLERIYERPGPTRTANVIGRFGAARTGNLILLAHHDSKSQNLTFPFRLGATLLAVLGTLGLLAGLALRMLSDQPLQAAVPVAGALAVVGLLVLSTLTSGNRSPGGVDNAGSVAIVLELAHLLRDHLPDGVGLIVLSPGAEEDHMVGAMRWLDRHGQELAAARALAINFDGVGNRGRQVVLERYGLGRRFSPLLSQLAREAARRTGIRLRGILMPPGMGIDSIPFAHRGVDCLTFSSGSLNRATLAIHSAGDVADNLDAATLEEGARLAAETAFLAAAELARQ